MRIPRVFVPPEDISATRVIFQSKNARYLKKVLRLKPGDRIQVFNDAAVHQVKLIDFLTEKIVGEITETQLYEKKQAEIILAFGCVRPGPFEQILRHGTELGVTVFIPVITARVNRKPEYRKERWDSVIRSAVAQCGRVAVPYVEPPISLSELLKRDLSSQENLILSTRPDAKPLLRWLDQSSHDRTLILVGPEGGFEQTEELQALKVGFNPVSLGSYPLRTETAAILASGIIAAARDCPNSNQSI